MANDTENLVLRILQDIQTTLASHSGEFKRIHGELKYLNEKIFEKA